MYVGTHDFKYCLIHLSIKTFCTIAFRIVILDSAHVTQVPSTIDAKVCVYVSYSAVIISVISTKLQQSTVDLTFSIFANLRTLSNQKGKKI